MSFTGFEWDVFISYAHNDDLQRSLGDKGWVKVLYEDLADLLPSKLGKGPAPRIFYDGAVLGPHKQVIACSAAARQSAVFLLVASISYFSGAETLAELDAFKKSGQFLLGDQDTNLMVMECQSITEETMRGISIGNPVRIPFWTAEGNDTRPLYPDETEYRRRIHQLANDIAKSLKSVRSRSGPLYNSGAQNTGRENTVLLAKTTDDLDEEQSQVETYLKQWGVHVLRTDAYRLDAQHFKEHFAQDLRQASLCVQLLGRRIGATPLDIPEGYARFQAHIREEMGIPGLLWRSPDITQEMVANPAHWDLLKGTDVFIDTLESFKAHIRHQLLPKPAVSSKQEPHLFINANRKDEAFAASIQKQLGDRIAMRSKVFSPSRSADNRKALAEFITNCDIMFLLNGNAKLAWFDEQLKAYDRYRTEGRTTPPRLLLEVAIEPPAKLPHGWLFPEMKTVRLQAPVDRDGIDPDGIDRILKEWPR